MILRSEIEKKVIDIIKEMLQEKDMEVDMDYNLRGGTGMNSMTLISAMFQFEKEFGIIIEDDDIQKMITLTDVVSYIEQAVG